MTDDKPGETRKATGFAALGELASDISFDCLKAAQDARPAESDEFPVTNADDASPPPPTQSAGLFQGSQAAAGGRSVLTGKGKVILGILAVIGAIWLFSEWNTSTYMPVSRAVEIKPPVGSGLVLSSDQIRYCLSENLRLNGAKGALNQYSQSDIDRFNAMIADYNSRCGNFRYREDLLEGVSAEVEADKRRLQSEGAARSQSRSADERPPRAIALQVALE